MVRDKPCAVDLMKFERISLMSRSLVTAHECLQLAGGTPYNNPLSSCASLTSVSGYKSVVTGYILSVTETTLKLASLAPATFFYLAND